MPYGSRDPYNGQEDAYLDTYMEDRLGAYYAGDDPGADSPWHDGGGDWDDEDDEDWND